MASGSGQGTPIHYGTPMGGVYDQFEELVDYGNCAVPLARYAKLIGYDECAFWGVVYEGQAQAACSTLWTEFERMTMAQALAEAQAAIEDIAGYPLCPRWVMGELEDEPNGDTRWVDEQEYRGHQMTRYSHVIEAGVRAVTPIASGAAVNHATDPAVVGPVATAATAVDEIHVFYPGSDREITPSRVSLAGGNVTIEIPRCRLVAEDRLSNPEGGWMYDDDSNFLAEVDVRRIYNDPSTAAVLVQPGCQNNACNGGCGECTHTACIDVRNGRLGLVDVRPATYADGVWTRARPCRGYARVRLNYRCGVQTLSLQAEMAIVRLAHARSPEAPCQCAQTEHLWARDRKVPEIMTREQLNCPLGLEQGAWVAYQFAKSLRVVRASSL